MFLANNKNSNGVGALDDEVQEVTSVENDKTDQQENGTEKSTEINKENSTESSNITLIYVQNAFCYYFRY